MCYIASGSGRFQINSAWFDVTQGDLLIIRRGDTHDIVTDDHNPLRIYYFEFYIRAAAGEIAPYCDILSLFESTGSVNRICHSQETAASLFQSIFSELTQQKRFYGNVIESLSMQLLIDVLRSFAGEKLPPADSFDERNGLAQQIIRYMTDHFETVGNLYDLADHFRYSYSHLAHIFREQTGMSLRQYYDRMRFDRALEMLQKGDDKITVIASRLKYQSVNAFSKAFSKKFGLSPSEYVASYQNRSSYNPQYEQGRKLMLDQDMRMHGSLFFCGGSCLIGIPTAIPDRNSETSDDFIAGRSGCILQDPHDPIYD